MSDVKINYIFRISSLDADRERLWRVKSKRNQTPGIRWRRRTSNANDASVYFELQQSRVTGVEPEKQYKTHPSCILVQLIDQLYCIQLIDQLYSRQYN